MTTELQQELPPILPTNLLIILPLSYQNDNFGKTYQSNLPSWFPFIVTTCPENPTIPNDVALHHVGM